MAYDSILQPAFGILGLVASIAVATKGIAVRNDERDRAVASVIVALSMGTIAAVALLPEPPIWTVGLLVVAAVVGLAVATYWQVSGRADHSRSRV